MRPVGLFLATLLLVAGCGAAETERRDAEPPLAPYQQPSPVPENVPENAPQTRPPAVHLQVTGWWAWALLDRHTGEIHGSANRAAQTSSTESMVKAWLAADYLAGVVRQGRGPNPTETAMIRQALRVSDDDAAQWLYLARGGDATIRRMIEICRLTGTTAHSGYWALTRITAQDAASLGGCLAGGAALDPWWTEWLLREMRSVSASDAFGIREAFDPATARRIAIKNGWTPRSTTGQWHVSCLGVADDWSLAVLVRYPLPLGLSYGAGVCREVARQLFRA